MSVTINRLEMQFRTPIEMAAGLEPSWDLWLISEVADGFGGVARSMLGPLTPVQAEARGFPLSRVLDEASAQAITLGAKANAERDEAVKARDAAEVATQAAIAEATVAKGAERRSLGEIQAEEAAPSVDGEGGLRR